MGGEVAVFDGVGGGDYRANKGSVKLCVKDYRVPVKASCSKDCLTSAKAVSFC